MLVLPLLVGEVLEVLLRVQQAVRLRHAPYRLDLLLLFRLIFVIF